MSKVLTNGVIPKSKMLRRNRRVETRKKNAERLTKTKYSGSGYWLDTDYIVGKYKLVTIPAREKVIGHYETYRDPVYDDNGNFITSYINYKFIKDGIETIPEHQEYKKITTTFEPRTTPIIRRYTYNIKKYYRTKAAKMLRRINTEQFADYIPLTGNGYKKHFDLWWTIN